MKSRIVVAAALSLTILAAVFEPAAAESSRKCRPSANPRFADAPELVYVVDQQVVDSTVVRAFALEEDSVASVEIMCADELFERFGLKTRANAVVVFTVPGARRLLAAALDSIAARQHAHLAKHGAFARTLTDLGWHDPSRTMTIELAVSDDGNRWSASGRHEASAGTSPALTISGERTPR